MTRTFILSHETVCQLLEAHASLAAWYFQLSDALRATGGEVEPPDEGRRKAFLEQLATSFPEIAEAARSIEQPQAYIPPPVFAAPPAAVPSPVDPAALAAAPADVPTQADGSGAAPVTPQGAAPPPPPPLQPPLVSTEQQPAETAASGGEPPADPPAASNSPEDAVAPPPMVDPKKVRYD